MTMLKQLPIASLKPAQLCLLGTAACLIAIHLTLVSRTNQLNLFSSSMLFWAAIAALVWGKRQELLLKSAPVSMLVGVLLIGLVLLRSWAIVGYDPVLRITPLLSGLGMALLASGFKEIKQYWRELLLLGFLVPSPGALAFIIDISTQTAQFATYVLWHLGFVVVREGVYVNLPQGSVEVYPGCSGIESMFHLLGLAVLFLLMFPTTRAQKFLVPVLALAIGFIVNGFRVALMAFLAAYSSRESLDYWHTGQGSLIFSMLAVFLLGICCFYILQGNIAEEEIADE